jgi:hypothetical protein
MYNFLLILHNATRWLVLLSLLFAIGAALHGWLTQRAYSQTDVAARVLATTISHTQLLIGISLYFISPVIQYFMAHTADSPPAISFFGIQHAGTMLVAVVAMTVGSSLAKRAKTDERRFRLIAGWFGLGLLLILSAIPWPFIADAARPWIRPF